MFERLKRLLQAAMHDLVEKASDPELELSRFVDEVELSLGEVRAEIAPAEALRATVAVEAADARERAADWMAKAERAVAAGDDPVARLCLVRHRGADDEADVAEERLAEADLALATLRNDEAQLERKLKEARLEQKRLSSRLRRAEAQMRSGKALAAGEIAALPDGMHERMLDVEAEGDALHEVYGPSPLSELSQLAAPSIDEELAALKRRIAQG